MSGHGPGRRAAHQEDTAYDTATEAGDELTDLVIAARSGDRRAAEELIAAHLPLLYRVVGRALDGHADVDDVVQETILRAHRDLPHLRTPASFRSWLLAIAMHQISSRLRSWQLDRNRSAPLDDATQLPDPGSDFTDLTLLRVTMSSQRRQVAEASRWLDPGDRDLAALWWRETSGELSRAEVVAALGVDPAHARVRIQRMRQQLELSRFLVAALDSEPRCPVLDRLTAGWDGTPRSRWRKRFARHVRDCPGCGPVRSDFLPLERLLAGASLILVPGVAGLDALSGVAAGSATVAAAGSAGAAGTAAAGTAAAGTAAAGTAAAGTAAAGTAAAGTAAAGTAAAGTAAAGGGVAGWLGQMAGAKAVAVLVVGATVSGGAYLALPDDPPGQPAVNASAAPLVPEPATDRPARTEPRPTRAQATGEPAAEPAPSQLSAPVSATGPVYAVIRPVTRPDGIVAVDQDALVVATGTGTVVTLVAGLADNTCLSFRAADNRYVRHSMFRLVLSADEGSDLFRQDATFCPTPGSAPGTVRLTAKNYPDRYVRVRDGKLLLDPKETTSAYEADSTFAITKP